MLHDGPCSLCTSRRQRQTHLSVLHQVECTALHQPLPCSHHTPQCPIFFSTNTDPSVRYRAAAARGLTKYNHHLPAAMGKRYPKEMREAYLRTGCTPQCGTSTQQLAAIKYFKDEKRCIAWLKAARKKKKKGQTL